MATSNFKKGNPAFNEKQAVKGKRGFESVSDRPTVRKSIGVRLYEDQVDAFEQACKDSGMTRVDLVRHLVDLYLGSGSGSDRTDSPKIAA